MARKGGRVASYDVIVIGGGTMGAAAACALGRRGARTLVLEQFGLVHARGSHGGKTRIIRQAYAESPDYVPLVQRAEALWLQLERETGTTILHRTGGLDLARPGYAQARDARRAAEEHHLPYEWLDGAEVRRRWPAWTIDDAWEACYSPRTGFLEVEPALRSLFAVARQRKVEVRTEEPARSIQTNRDGVTVRTDRDTYHADRLIVTAGAWAGRVLGSLDLPLTVVRKVLWWLKVDDPSLYEPDRFPVFISEGPLGNIYGLPIYGSPALKIADHGGGDVADPDAVDREVRARDLDPVARFARSSLRGVTDQALESAVCLYTLTPDRDFIVDRSPDTDRVALAAGFSGHGFKFAPAIGELLADLILDPGSRPLPRFALARFGSRA